MERREQGRVDTGPLEREFPPAELRDALLGVEQQLRREVPERDDHARLDQRELAVEPRRAGLDLVGLGVAVAGRAALHDVGDVHVVAGETDPLDELRQQLSGASHERLSLEVLLLAGAFTDEQEVGIGPADAEHHLRTPGRELAQLAHRGRARDVGETRARLVGGMRGCVERVE